MAKYQTIVCLTRVWQPLFQFFFVTKRLNLQILLVCIVGNGQFLQCLYIHIVVLLRYLPSLDGKLNILSQKMGKAVAKLESDRL